jgi:hypothetical protein
MLPAFICAFSRATLMLSEWHCKEAPVNQQGRLQHNLGYPEGRWNEYLKLIWIFIHTKWQCCLNLQFKAEKKIAFAEWAQKNETSFNNMWFSDEACFHLDGVVNKHDMQLWVSENPHVIQEKVHHAPHLKSWTARVNFLWRDSEQWALFKHVVQYFCASTFCYRFAFTNSVVHAGWSQVTHSKCCFRISAWHFRLMCHLKPIS